MESTSHLFCFRVLFTYDVSLYVIQRGEKVPLGKLLQPVPTIFHDFKKATVLHPQQVFITFLQEEPTLKPPSLNLASTPLHIIILHSLIYHTSQNSIYKWTKISSLDINIFEINHISLICLEFFILKPEGLNWPGRLAGISRWI